MMQIPKGWTGVEAQLASDVKRSNGAILRAKQEVERLEAASALLKMRCNHRHTKVEGLDTVCAICGHKL